MDLLDKIIKNKSFTITENKFEIPIGKYEIEYYNPKDLMFYIKQPSPLLKVGGLDLLKMVSFGFIKVS